MTEDQKSAGEELAPAAEATAPAPGFGALLRAERQRQGLSEGDMVARLRLHPKQVKAIEAEDIAALPGPAYVRGFVRAYARNLGMAPEPLLADVALKLGETAPAVDALVDDSPRSPVREAARERNSRRFVMIGSVLALVVLGLVGWWASRPPAIDAPEPPPAPVAELAPAPAAPAAPAEVVDATPPPPPAPLLKLNAEGKSWVKVEGSDGVVLLETLLDAGSEETVEGIPPITVVIGDASRVKVELRGEPVDLAPHTQRNVARLRLE